MSPAPDESVAVPDHDPATLAGEGVGEVGEEGDDGEAEELPPPLQPAVPAAMKIAATIRPRENRLGIIVKTRRILARPTSLDLTHLSYETPRSLTVRPTRAGSWILFLAVLFIVMAWPPAEGRSLMVKALNFAVDPADSLPVLPPQLGFGLSDDVQAVEMRDEIVRRYDAMYSLGGMTRARMRLKVAEDPLDAATERQLLLVFGVVVAFLTLRSAQR